MSLLTDQTRIITNSIPVPAPSCKANPANVSHLNTAYNGSATGIAIEGTRVYMLEDQAIGNDSLIIYDISNPAALAFLKDQLLIGGAFAVNQPQPFAIAVKNNLAYVANYRAAAGQSFLAIYDCTNPLAITQVGTLSLSAGGTSNTEPTKIGLLGKFACVPFGDNVEIIDVSVPAVPVLAATVVVADVGGNGVAGVFTVSGTLYASAKLDLKLKAWTINAVTGAATPLFSTAFVDVNAIRATAVYVANGVAAAGVQDTGIGKHGTVQLINATTGAILGVYTNTVGDHPDDVFLNTDATCMFLALGDSPGDGKNFGLVDISTPSAPVAGVSFAVSGAPTSAEQIIGNAANIFVGGNGEPGVVSLASLSI